MTDVEYDAEHEVHFEVRIRGFGRRQQVEDRLVLALARAIHHGASTTFEIRLAGTGGSWLRFDPKADDMGNHGPEHLSPLLPSEAGG